ncbi:hypothetical protein BDR26DRAFT_869318 [Obelidium mucronatum]|nr:hypothetical protein BDR26DRAFT_869318 [Obelidium mucronatum]
MIRFVVLCFLATGNLVFAVLSGAQGPAAYFISAHSFTDGATDKYAVKICGQTKNSLPLDSVTGVVTDPNNANVAPATCGEGCCTITITDCKATSLTYTPNFIESSTIYTDDAKTYSLTIDGLSNTNCWSSVSLYERVFALTVPTEPKIYASDHTTLRAESAHPKDFIDIKVGVSKAGVIDLPNTFKFQITRVDIKSLLKNSQGSAQIVAAKSDQSLNAQCKDNPTSNFVTVTSGTPDFYCFSVQLCEVRSKWAGAATPEPANCYDTGLDSLSNADGINTIEMAFTITGTFKDLNAKKKRDAVQTASFTYTLQTGFQVSSSGSPSYSIAAEPLSNNLKSSGSDGGWSKAIAGVGVGVGVGAALFV